MASTWRATFVLVDTKALKTTLNFIYEADNLTLADEFADANTAMDDLKTDLDAVTDANFYSETLTLLKSGNQALPADADITDLAKVAVHLSPAGEIPKYATLRIPAPISALFESDGVTVDETNANLIAYVAELANWTVSDGETIQTANDNGIASGWWASASKSTR